MNKLRPCRLPSEATIAKATMMKTSKNVLLNIVVVFLIFLYQSAALDATDPVRCTPTLSTTTEEVFSRICRLF